MTSASAILNRAADLIRDTAAAATQRRWTSFVTLSGGASVLSLGSDGPGTPITGGEVAAAPVEADGRWIALMSPAVAEAQELILRNAAKDYDVQARIFTPEAMKQKLTDRRFAGPLALARAVLDGKDNTDG